MKKTSLFSLVFILQIMTCWLPFKVVAADLPQYEWTKTITGTDGSWATSVANTNEGEIIVVGGFYGTYNFNPEGEADNHTSNGSGDCFISKYSADGSVIWTKTFGGTLNDQVNTVTVDSNDNLYIIGNYSGTVNFNPGGEADSRTSNGNSDVFVSKYDVNGARLWTKTIGGISLDKGNSVALDSSNNIYIIGSFSGTVNFNPEGVADSRISNGNWDIFLTKYDNSGSRIWTKTIGGVEYDSGQSLAIDSNNNLVITGNFLGEVNFNPGGIADSHNCSLVGNCIFLTKFLSNGSYSWTQYHPGMLYATQTLTTSNNDNSIYLAGTFSNTVNFSHEGLDDNRTSVGSGDVFLSKYSPSGSRLWTKNFGSLGMDNVYSTRLDRDQNVYITGFFGETADFNPGGVADIITENSSWESSLYLTSYNSSGLYLGTKTSTGGVMSDSYGLTIHDSNAYIAGDVYGTVNFDAQGEGDLINGDSGDGSMFLSKYTLSLSPLPTPTPTPITASSQSTTQSGQEEEPYQIQAENPQPISGFFKPTKDSTASSDRVTIYHQPETFSFNAYVSSQTKSLNELPLLDRKGNTFIAGNSLLGFKLNQSVYWQVGEVQEIWYKAYPPRNSNLTPAKIIPSLQLKDSIISLSYQDGDLIPPGDINHPFKPISLKLAHSLDGLTWTIIKNSVVDPINKTVSAINKIGGFYMIVGK